MPCAPEKVGSSARGAGRQHQAVRTGGAHQPGPANEKQAVQPPLVLEQRPALVDRRPIEQRLERGEDDLALDLLGQVRERAARPVKGGGRASNV
jgi:hypothetical protein